MRTAFCVLQKCEFFEIKPQECSQTPLSGPSSAVFGKKYAGSTFAILSFS